MGSQPSARVTSASPSFAHTARQDDTRPNSVAASDVRGLGIDLVELPRFSVFLCRNEPALGEVFTESEIALADASACRDTYLAIGWAVKEAVMKALGTGWAAGVAWTDVEVLGQALAPEVRLQGAAKLVAERAGARSVCVSASSAGPCVIAVAVLLG